MELLLFEGELLSDWIGSDRLTDVCVQVIDKCVGCPQGGLDLWPGTFASLAELGVGVISASWEFVPC
jgi:expansin (peptidoglycan-binding protein)